MKISSLRLCALAFVFTASCSFGQAPVITSAEIERGLSISGPASNGYVPLSHRYFYGTGPYIYLNGDPRMLTYLDYLDRADRAQKFGYRMPLDPFFEAPAPVIVYPEVQGYIGVGGGHGFLRRR
jgi:hypothetical protein